MALTSGCADFDVVSSNPDTSSNNIRPSQEGALSVNSDVPKDDELRALVVGKWMETTKPTSEGYLEITTEYRSDGTYVCGTKWVGKTQFDDNGKEISNTSDCGGGGWSITGHILTLTFHTKGQTTTYIDHVYTTPEEILEIDANHMKYNAFQFENNGTKGHIGVMARVKELSKPEAEKLRDTK